MARVRARLLLLASGLAEQAGGVVSVSTQQKITAIFMASVGLISLLVWVFGTGEGVFETGGNDAETAGWVPESGLEIPAPKMAAPATISPALQTRGARENTFYPPYPGGSYSNEEEARAHPCMDGEPPMHLGVWELAYEYAYDYLRWDLPSYMVVDDKIIPDPYLEPAYIESVQILTAEFGRNVNGQRLLGLFLSLRVKDILGNAETPYFRYRFLYRAVIDDETCDILSFRRL